MKKTFAPIQSDFYKYTVESFIKEVLPVTKADYGFQSRVRWIIDNKRSYITSLILGMAPSKYILASTDACKVTSKNSFDKKYYERWNSRKVDFLNIDSNNRVTTISEFISDQFGIQPGFYEISGQIIEIVEGSNDTFSTLPDVVKQSLLSSPLTIEIITASTRNQLSNLFRRMNDGMSLNGPEKRNSEISEFADTIRSLATDYEKTLTQFFSPKDINRRKIDDFIAGLSLMYFHGVTYTISDKTLWAAYESGSTEDQLIGKFQSDFKNFISLMGDVINSIPNKNSVLDLLLIYKDLKDNGYIIQNKDQFFDDFLKVHAELLKDQTKHEYRDGRDATYKELLRSRESAFNQLRQQEILKKFDPKKYCVKLDPRRNFSKEEKFIAAVDQNWVTPEGKTIDKSRLFDPSAYHGGHIVPHADGGETVQENCAIQESNDNLKLGKNVIVQ